MKAEQRTGAELVREAFSTYLSARPARSEQPTRAEAPAYREGMADYKRGANVTPQPDDNGSGRRRRVCKEELAEFFESMAANSKRIPRLPDTAFARESFYKDHD